MIRRVLLLGLLVGSAAVPGIANAQAKEPPDAFLHSAASRQSGEQLQYCWPDRSTSFKETRCEDSFGYYGAAPFMPVGNTGSLRLEIRWNEPPDEVDYTFYVVTGSDPEQVRSHSSGRMDKRRHEVAVPRRVGKYRVAINAAWRTDPRTGEGKDVTWGFAIEARVSPGTLPKTPQTLPKTGVDHSPLAGATLLLIGLALATSLGRDSRFGDGPRQNER